MARYKVLKSVAHSLVHSFTSALNWGDADYVMGNLLQRARDIGAGTLAIDLINGEAEPSALCTPPVQRAVEKYSEWLRRLVTTHKSDMPYVRWRTYLSAVTGGHATPGGGEGANAELVDLTWIPLRDETSWPPDIRADVFLYPQLQAIQRLIRQLDNVTAE
jgi:hypothetical protein